MATMSAREFNQNVSGAKRAALDAPVVITDRGKASHVLISIDDYRRLTGSETSWVHRIQMDEDIEFEIPRLDFDPRIPDL